MEKIKTSANVEFDVIYADGTRRHVTEGVCLRWRTRKSFSTTAPIDRKLSWLQQRPRRK